MRNNDSRKQERLSLVRVTRTPEELAQLELAERLNRLALAKGGKRPRRFSKLQVGELYPLRLVGRLTDDAIRARADEDGFLDAVVGTVTRLIRRKQGHAVHMTGDYPLAS
jgi:hypothetical protein